MTRNASKTGVVKAEEISNKVIDVEHYDKQKHLYKGTAQLLHAINYSLLKLADIMASSIDNSNTNKVGAIFCGKSDIHKRCDCECIDKLKKIGKIISNKTDAELHEIAWSNPMLLCMLFDSNFVEVKRLEIDERVEMIYSAAFSKVS